MEEKTLTKTIKVEEEQLAVSMGSGGLAVLATPAVVALMENAAFELCEEILPPSCCPATTAQTRLWPLPPASG